MKTVVKIKDNPIFLAFISVFPFLIMSKFNVSFFFGGTSVLIVVGVLLWLENRFIPMQATIKSILNGVVVIAVVLWLMNAVGLFHSISRIHIGRG